MNRKKHDIPRIIKTATGAVFAVAAAAVFYANNYAPLESAVILESTSVSCDTYIDGRRESVAGGEKVSVSGALQSSLAVKAPEVDFININTATFEELQTLSGIGEAKAAAIIAYRVEHGIFNDISEIMNVNGIGEKIFEKIRGQITV